MNKKVNLFVIGASKCGTTSLWSMLNEHSDIVMSIPKEPYFFTFSDYKTKFEKYHNFFKGYNNEKYMGEATPIYSETTLNPDLPKRLYDYNSNAKIIFLVRNPIDRLKSAYRQLLFSGHDRKVVYKNYTDVEVPLMPKEFTKAIYEHPNFIEACKYETHLNNYLKYFNKGNVGVFFFEDLKNDSEIFFKEICSFLELDYQFKPEMAKVKNPSLGRKRDFAIIDFIKNNKFVYKYGYKLKKSLGIPAGFLKKEIEYDIDFPEEERAKILNVLNGEIKGILNYAEKPSDFWKI